MTTADQEPELGEMTQYLAFCIRVSFFGNDGLSIESWNDPDAWEFSPDEDQNAAIISSLSDELRSIMAPYAHHLGCIGGLRCDGSSAVVFNGEVDDEDRDITFYLIVQHTPDEMVKNAPVGAELGHFSPLTVSLRSLPGLSATISVDVENVAPAKVFRALLDRSVVDGAGIWSGLATPELLPGLGEACDEWLARVAQPSAFISELVYRWQACGANMELFAALTPLAATSARWLVEGVIPRGMVTLFAGSGGSGKSSAAQELLSVVTGVAASRDRSFLGVPVIDPPGIGVMIVGEEAGWVIEDRLARHRTIWQVPSLPVLLHPDGGIVHTLSLVDRMPRIDLLVIDPAQVFIDGDDTRSNVASDFYNPLVAFAERKECAVVVVHHLVKHPPRNFRQFSEGVKGSTVHVDRARMNIGFIDRGNGLTEVGPFKFNLPQDQVWIPQHQGCLFRRDNASHTLIPVDDGRSARSSETASISGPVLQLIRRMNETGERVCRTGKYGLYELRAPELAGISRAKIGDAVASLLGEGKLLDGDAGLVVIPGDGSGTVGDVGRNNPSP